MRFGNDKAMRPDLVLNHIALPSTFANQAGCDVVAIFDFCEHYYLDILAQSTRLHSSAGYQCHPRVVMGCARQLDPITDVVSKWKLFHCNILSAIWKWLHGRLKGLQSIPC
jgi:hypothetical protein